MGLRPKLENLVVTGLPTEESEALKAGALEQMFPGPRRTCVSARQAEQAFTIERLRLPDFSNEDCRFERASLTGGRVDWAGTCRSGRSHRRFSVTGSVTSRSIDLVWDLDDSVPSEGGRVQTSLRMTGRRLGPCDGTEAALERPMTRAPEERPESSGTAASNAAATDLPADR